jgi:hypothetical protein
MVIVRVVCYMEALSFLRACGARRPRRVGDLLEVTMGVRDVFRGGHHRTRDDLRVSKFCGCSAAGANKEP